MERFLISILGTTLSIALTFGTTALVNSHKKKTAQSLTDYYGKNLQEDLDAHPRRAHKGSFNLTRSKTWGRRQGDEIRTLDIEEYIQ
jgi:hypothetical protein